MKNREVRNSIFILIVITLLSFASAAFAGTYWVSPKGMAKWANCQGDIPLSGMSACSLATANTNAVAGDNINMRGGTYNIPIKPSNSGSSTKVITYQAYTGETPILTDVGSVAAINIDGVDYIKIDGVTVTNVYRLAEIANGAHYNEITNSTLSGGSDVGNSGLIIRSFDGTGNTHNWIHNNIIYQAGYVTTPPECNDASNLMKIGSSDDTASGYNTIEDNILYWGGHHTLEINTIGNVIRNNYFHNEGWMVKPSGCAPCGDANGKYGNRNIIIYDAQKRDATYTLIENNRIGHTGLPSDGNGGDNLTLGGNKIIVRYNAIFDAMETGMYFRTSSVSSNFNRVYNNTIYKSGQGPACRYNNYAGFTRLGARFQKGADNNVFLNNIVYDNKTSDIADNGGGNTLTNNWVTTDGDPLFVNPDISNPMSTTLPNLSLQRGSGAINKGTYLTQAKGSGSNSTTLSVDDALYFQDGTWGSSLSNIQADWIAIGTVSNRVQIRSINYSTNTITLKSPMTWKDNAKIWLYKDSSGRIVLWGSAPDIGAHEFNTSVPYLFKK